MSRPTPPGTRIPSLISLRAFEAVARHRSMTRAAKELHVTHSAVSKQIQSLEEALSVALIRRLPREIEPTAEGARLAATLSTAFGLIETGISQIHPSSLSVSCSASIMTRWLIPRLPRFKENAPQIDLRLSAAHGPLNLMREGIDLAIRNDIVPAGDDIIIRHLMQETVGPVCAPAYAEKHRLQRPEDLRRVQILATHSRPQAWADWEAAAGWDGPALGAHQTYEHFYLTLQSAACGLGVAMAPRYLVADDLNSGHLVAPFGFVQGRRNVVLWMSPQARKREGALAFARWLQQEARQTVEDSERNPAD